MHVHTTVESVNTKHASTSWDWLVVNTCKRLV